MLEQISQLVKQYGQEAVVNNPDISNQDNNAVMAEATTTITSGMQNMLAGGGLQDLISMFTSGSKGKSNGIAGFLKNPMVMMMVGHLISKLTGKFKMNPSQASRVSNNLIPNVVSDMVSRTVSNDPSNDAFDLNDLIGSLTGGNPASSESTPGGFNFQDLLGKLTGGSSGDSGGVDLNDIIGKVTAKAQESTSSGAQAGRGGGGIADLVKSFFN